MDWLDDTPIGARPHTSSTLSTMVTLQLADGSVESGWCRKEACPVKCVGVMSRVWATLLALYVMKIKYSDKEEEWELVATEAEGWLKKQSLPSDLTLEQQVFKNG